jgi:hypothetical protein
MEENNKVIIFEKKEIILILVFFIILVIISFTLGIRLGKKLTLEREGVKDVDIKTVELKSVDEEEVDKTFLEDSKLSDDEKIQKLREESKGKLIEELESFSKPDVAPALNSSEVKPSVEVNNELNLISPVGPGLKGKFTIQLGSYSSAEEAKEFAEGFTVRGYDPIINEVKIPEKGNWYRVSLGVFDSPEDAKKYINQERSLFEGQEYILTEIR